MHTLSNFILTTSLESMLRGGKMSWKAAFFLKKINNIKAIGHRHPNDIFLMGLCGLDALLRLSVHSNK